MSNIEKLYHNFAILADAKEKVTEHEKEYIDIIGAVKGSTNEKKLASQFIARFFKHFPGLMEEAMEAQLDLCEDDDITVRKQVIKNLPSLCRDKKGFVVKIADVLAQLLQSDDPAEMKEVQNSLMTLFRIDAKGALCGLFSQILNEENQDEDEEEEKAGNIIRERSIKFLSVKMKALGPEVFDKEVEEFLWTKTKDALKTASAEEFLLLISTLGQTRRSHTVSGHLQIVEMIAEQLNLEEPLDVTELEQVDKLAQCVKQALPYFSTQVKSTKFVSYICDSVLPSVNSLPASSTHADPQLEVLKMLAEMAPHAGILPDSSAKLQIVFDRLLEYMPLPRGESDETTVTSDEPKLQFSYVECLMYTLHALGKSHPEFLTQDQDRLKDFKLRLQYLARGTQGYVKKLREDLQGKETQELKKDENRIKAVALKTTSNINTLIKDLFHNPPSYKSIVSLSWKPAAVSKSLGSTDTGTKRHTPITFDSSSTKQHKGSGREMYAPPSGKYSDKVSGYVPQSRGGRSWGRGRGRGRGRGYFRGGRGYRSRY